MKYLVVVSVIAVMLCACGNGVQTTEKGEGVKIKTRTASNNTDVFNSSFEQLLSSYYALKDASVNYDTVQMNAAAKAVGAGAMQLPLDAMKADSTGAERETAKSYTNTIYTAAMQLTGKNDIDQKRRDFYAISNALYDLARTVKYDRQTIYHQHCPMAFNGEEEAYWLSNSSKIVNPYLGNKHPKYRAAMAGCGDITDSLGYAK